MPIQQDNEMAVLNLVEKATARAAIIRAPKRSSAAPAQSRGAILLSAGLNDQSLSIKKRKTRLKQAKPASKITAVEENFQSYIKLNKAVRMKAAATDTPAAVRTVQSWVSLASERTPCLIAIRRAIEQIRWERQTAKATPMNLAIMNIGRWTGLLKTVWMVLFSISSAIVPEAAKTAMNKLAKNSVDRPNSLRSTLSSSSVYIVMEGLRKRIRSVIIMIIA